MNSTVRFFPPTRWFRSNCDWHAAYYITLLRCTEETCTASFRFFPLYIYLFPFLFFAVIRRYSGRRRCFVVGCFVVVIFERGAARRWSAAHLTPNNPKPQQIILEYVGNYLRRSLGLAGVKRIIWWRAELFDVNQDNSTGRIIPDHDVDKQPDARPSCTVRSRLNGRNERKK